MIVEDNSPDGTGEIVRSMLPEYLGRLFMLERKGKLGLGTAYIAGFRWALERNYGYIFEMDCDFSHNPDDLLKLYDACKNQGADLAIGSRFLDSGGFDPGRLPYRASLMRRCGMALFGTIASLLIKQRVNGL